MKNLKMCAVAVAAVCLLATVSGSAAPLTVTSYSMYNGGTGSFDYRDFTYLPCPGNNCDTTSAPLSGGTGKLTDGVSPSQSWYQYGWWTPWVGWYIGYANNTNPTVTFNFGGPVTVNSVTVWVDNTIGYGGVGLPSEFTVSGIPYFIPADNVDPNPRAYTLSGLNITASSVNVQFFQGTQPWIMVGEVTFNGTTTPEPATMTLVGSGLALAWWRRRKARS